MLRIFSRNDRINNVKLTAAFPMPKNFSAPPLSSALRVFAALAALALPAAALAAETLAPRQQNALIQKYCAVCHTDAVRNGGLSLEHYDAAQPDPALAAMLLSKLRTGAMGAAGVGIPEPEIRQAWVAATAVQAAGAQRWSVLRSSDSAADDLVTASIVRQLPSPNPNVEPDSYRLIVTCRPATRRASVELAWSPNVPAAGAVMAAEVDGKPFSTWKIDGAETYGNGMNGSSGPGAIMLSGAKPGMPLPAGTLAIRDVFPSQTVVFPFSDLPADGRQALAACFPARQD
jgi:mono/diheme cytochrome c family protein